MQVTINIPKELYETVSDDGYIELVIKLPKEAKQAFDCAESNDLKGCYYDIGGVIGTAIKNGVSLPKGHGDLVDRDALENVWHEEFLNGMSISAGMLNTFRDAPTIIEADK